MSDSLARDEASGERKRFSVRGASVLALRDGLAFRQTEYWDLATLLRQLERPLPSPETLTGHTNLGAIN